MYYAYYVYGVKERFKFKKGDYVKIINPHSFFRGLVLRVNRRIYDDYLLEVIPDIPCSKLRMSKENISRSLKHRSFSENSLKLYNLDKLDGDKL